MVAWAQHSLALKNTLMVDDARAIEEAFGKQIKGFEDVLGATAERPAASDADIHAGAARSSPHSAISLSDR